MHLNKMRHVTYRSLIHSGSLELMSMQNQHVRFTCTCTLLHLNFHLSFPYYIIYSGSISQGSSVCCPVGALSLLGQSSTNAPAWCSFTYVCKGTINAEYKNEYISFWMYTKGVNDCKILLQDVSQAQLTDPTLSIHIFPKGSYC